MGGHSGPLDVRPPLAFPARLDAVPPGLRGRAQLTHEVGMRVAQVVPTAEYLRERLETVAHFMPGASEIHVRLGLFERVIAAGVRDVATIFHQAGLLVDVWTLDAGTACWRQRLARAVDAGVDVVTTNTPRALAEGLTSSTRD